MQKLPVWCMKSLKNTMESKEKETGFIVPVCRRVCVCVCHACVHSIPLVRCHVFHLCQGSPSDVAQR